MIELVTQSYSTFSFNQQVATFTLTLTLTFIFAAVYLIISPLCLWFPCFLLAACVCCSASFCAFASFLLLLTCIHTFARRHFSGCKHAGELIPFVVPRSESQFMPKVPRRVPYFLTNFIWRNANGQYAANVAAGAGKPSSPKPNTAAGLVAYIYFPSPLWSGFSCFWGYLSRSHWPCPTNSSEYYVLREKFNTAASFQIESFQNRIFANVTKLLPQWVSSWGCFHLVILWDTEKVESSVLKSGKVHVARFRGQIKRSQAASHMSVCFSTASTVGANLHYLSAAAGLQPEFF